MSHPPKAAQDSWGNLIAHGGGMNPVLRGEKGPKKPLQSPHQPNCLHLNPIIHRDPGHRATGRKVGWVRFAGGIAGHGVRANLVETSKVTPTSQRKIHRIRQQKLPSIKEQQRSPRKKRCGNWRMVAGPGPISRVKSSERHVINFRWTCQDVPDTDPERSSVLFVSHNVTIICLYEGLSPAAPSPPGVFLPHSFTHYLTFDSDTAGKSI